MHLAFNVITAETLSERNAKNSPENSLPVLRNCQKTEMISLSYDVNDHAYSN